MTKTRIEVNICLQSPGKRTGDALLRWSDDARPLGVYPVPIACIVGGRADGAIDCRCTW